jgi:hypothetical protein
MASILPTTTTVPHGLYLSPRASDDDEVEEFRIPDLIKNSGPIRQFIEQRLAWGGGRKDEIWEGVYHMSPDPSNDHQELVSWLCYVFFSALIGTGAKVHAGGNVSDRVVNWYENYRCPDVIVILPNNPIQNRKTYWLGGPDFIVEVLSEGDDSVEKLPFYAKVGTREVLHVDPETKQLTLFSLREGIMQVVGSSSITDLTVVASSVLPVSFQVLGDPAKPILRMQHLNKPEQFWEI